MKSNKLNTIVENQNYFFLKDVYSIIGQALTSLNIESCDHLSLCYFLTRNILDIIFCFCLQKKSVNNLDKDFISNQLRLSNINYDTQYYNRIIDLILTSNLLDYLKRYEYSLEEGSNSNRITPYFLSLNFEYFSLNQQETNKIATSGTFYTHQQQIETINRLAIVNYLTGICTELDKSLLFNWLFASTESEKLHLLEIMMKKVDIKYLKQAIENIKVLDPACGTGSFLVDILDVLYNLQLCCNMAENIDVDPENIVKNIIENNIYGVDIDPEACEIAKLRLNLLFIKYSSKNPQLIDLLNYNIKCADSMVINWQETFKEIFNNASPGFDIIVGNPPYVRQEYITDPKLSLSNQEYKKEMALSIYKAYPEYFKYDKSKSKSLLQINAKSDLYMYFYFLALKLLKENGTVCYISSNSWLDVDYGNILRDFLLTYSTINLILEDLSTPAFALADVNTCIFLGTKCSQPESNNYVYFVSFKKSFDTEQLLSLLSNMPEENILEENEKFRLHSINQKDLLPSNIDQYKINSSLNDNITNKWGGYYLRSPSIYWEILHKCQDKLIKLNDVATIKFGIKSGANDFFYLNSKAIDQWKIEEEFLKPFLYSLKEVENYEVNPLLLEKKLFCCYQTKEELQSSGKTGALNYILWGESQNYHLRPSVSKRPQWYFLPEQGTNHFVSNRFLGERIAYPWIEDISVCDVFFVGSITRANPLLTVALFNSSLSLLSTEILARKTYSIGVAYMYGPELKLVDLVNPEEIPIELCDDIITTFNFMRKRKLFKLEDEFMQSDRQKLDEIIFNYLGLTNPALESVGESLIKMVKMRLRKN